MSTISDRLREIFGEDDGEPSNPVEDNNTQGTSNGGSYEMEGESTPSDDPVEEYVEEGDTNVVVQPNMQFDTLDSLFDAYQEHARLKGFSVVKRCSKKLGEGEDYKYALFVCDKAGSSKARKITKKINCKARLNAKKLDNGCWIISKMETKHNHAIDPVFSPLMAAHRHVSINMKRQLEANDIAGIRPCKNVRLCEVQCGGPQNLGCLPKDCRNFVEQRRRLRLGEGDAEAVRQLFIRLQLKDGNFYYTLDIDDEGRLRNVLWINPRSRAAYEEFHDVVSFDTTYLINRYKMPFASMVGVNHHGQSILLGCALVTHEDASSFRWLFSNWLQAMNGIHPNAIITDQCERIKIAIRELMPNTIHRFCIWHITSKIHQKFRGVRDFYRCTVEFKGLVYDSITIETFESKWAEFLTKYRLENNAWLRDLYAEREKWVPVYLHHTFWAGMISTQRSEGMHAYFDEFVHSRSTLKQFMEQYDMAMANKIQKEYIADFQSKNKVVKCSTHFRWEMQFQKVYTHSIFKLIQDEIQRMIYCHAIPPTEDEAANDENVVGVENYRVLERSQLNNFFFKEFTYTVKWRPNGAYINCNCRKFEFKGILCCHIMKVLAQNNIETVHERYVLQRWRKDVYRPHSSIVFAGGYPHMTEEYKKFQEVEIFFQECMDGALGCTEKMEFVKQKCLEMKNEILYWNPNPTANNEGGASQSTQATHASDTPILNPNVAIPRGRPRMNRYMSAAEVRGRGRRGGRGRGRGQRGARGARAAPNSNVGGNNESFMFDLNEEPSYISQGSVMF